MPNRRDFGRVRQLPSGKWQARYRDPDGLDRPAPDTFARKRDATDWLADKQAEIARGDWTDPGRGAETVGSYAARWIAERDVGHSTRDRYESVLRTHIVPNLGAVEVAQLREARVRSWIAVRREAGVTRATLAKAYRLLHAVMSTAVEDNVIRRNPCRVTGAGQEKSDERPMFTVAEVFILADAITLRYRALVLLAALTSLRLGELACLRRRDLDLTAGAVRVSRAQGEARGRGAYDKDTKSNAGRRGVALPAVILDDLAAHLERFAEPGADGLLFAGPKGGRLLRRNFHRHWTAALRAAGLAGQGYRFHDLRHTGNHFAALAGASTKELMSRMGHSSMRAALIYQHATDQRDRHIADAISDQVSAARGTPEANGHAAGTQGRD